MLLNIYPKMGAYRPGEKAAMALAEKAIRAHMNSFRTFRDKINIDKNYNEGHVRITNDHEAIVTLKGIEDAFKIHFELE